MVPPTALALALLLAPGGGRTINIHTDAALRAALADARPGDTIRLAPGTYRGGLFAENLHGTEDAAITITAADPDDPPVIRGGTQAIHLVDPRHVTLSHLVCEKQTGNGINIDDGGSFDTPAEHVTIDRIVVLDTGPTGNRDGIKLSGVVDFTVRNCTIERWGDRGSGIDMVGCHRGTITGCTFRHGDTTGNNGVQAKGGTADIRVLRCHFDHAGTRAVQLGGSTGNRFFRPPLGDPPHVEAERVSVAGCTFVGGQSAVAFVSSRDCAVRFCTVFRPTRWVIRILNERRGDKGFLPPQRGTFADNLIVWHHGDLHRTVNVGPDTEPGTFTFARNWWYCADAPAKSEPELPLAEEESVVGRDPRLSRTDEGEPQLADASAALPHSHRAVAVVGGDSPRAALRALHQALHRGDPIAAGLLVHGTSSPARVIRAMFETSAAAQRLELTIRRHHGAGAVDRFRAAVGGLVNDDLMMQFDFAAVPIRADNDKAQATLPVGFYEDPKLWLLRRHDGWFIDGDRQPDFEDEVSDSALPSFNAVIARLHRATIAAADPDIPLDAVAEQLNRDFADTLGDVEGVAPAEQSE